MQRQWEICWTARRFDTSIFHRIVLIWILLKSSGRRWSLSFVNSRHGRWMLFRTRYNVLFRQFRLLTAQAGSIPAAIRLIFENCYKSKNSVNMWNLGARPVILCLKASGTALCDSTKTLRCLVPASRAGRFKNEKQTREKTMKIRRGPKMRYILLFFDNYS